MNTTKIGFIGAGNMAGSLIRGLCAKGHDPASIAACNVNKPRLDALAADCGITIADSERIANWAEVVVLAVKPQVMADVCRELAPKLVRPEPPLLLSVAAGIPVEHLEHWLSHNPAVSSASAPSLPSAPPLPIVRCMPNTPALIGLGASGLFANDQVSAQQKQLSQAILDAVGITVWLNTEAELDGVTALSGSGPAYFFLFMEAMQEAAMELGLDAETARILTCQTASGAAALASATLSAERGEQDQPNASTSSLESLRHQVTSPGGTTEQAINQFIDGGLNTLVRKALQAAYDRSVSLAKEQSK
ncbi:MAG: pyrroline-5-carboxylate reductase [Pseudohongiellaceae bacterium]